ncbi:MAG: serine protease [Candidatus Brocadiia bacterium]
MRRYTVSGLALIVGLLVFGFPIKGQSPQSPEILIVDLSKKAPSNPYQTEYEKMLYPTVRIKALFSMGTGVVIDDYIITAAHVVGNSSTVTIELFHPDNVKLEASVVITDTGKDLALLKPAKPLLYSARLAPKDYTPYIFSPIWTVGCSLGLTPRPSSGIISVIEDTYWEVSSPVLPGNSGGPVYTLVPSNDGNASTYEVIGIAVWVRIYKDQLITTMAGIVPISEIYEFLGNVPTE